MQKELTFYFIRHGQTEWNLQGLMQGWGNSDLTEQGIVGAQLTGNALANVLFTVAYSSCLQRTIDTARHILGERDVPLFQHQGLNEQFFGSWEGKKADEIRQLTEFQQLVNDPAAYQAQSNQGETWEQLAERAMSALYDIIKIHDQGNILVVSHGHTLRLLIALCEGATWQNHRDNNRSQNLKNTSISVIRYQQIGNVGRFMTEKINDTAHLPQENA
ncbi:MAG: histidine phosphatase family protein [Pasteurellaceae bacterium]|nr:histidine phosphatase family protein [Pasteurellaceae bacterium]